MQSVTEFVDSFFPTFDTNKVASICARKRNVSIEEILTEWENKKEAACDLGEYVHAYIERELSEKNFPYEMTHLDKYSGYKTAADIVIKKLLSFYRVIDIELKVNSEPLQLAGRIDCVLENDHKVLLIDWKTSETIKYSNRWSEGLSPIPYLDDCNYNKYCLQLYVYKKICDSEGLFEKPIGCGIVHIKDGQYEFISVPKAFDYHAERIIQCNLRNTVS